MRDQNEEILSSDVHTESSHCTTVTRTFEYTIDTRRPDNASEDAAYAAGCNGSQNNSPLDQFSIKNLLSLDAPILGDASLSLTNIGLYLTLGSLIVIVLYLVSNNYSKIVSNSWSASQESVYATVHSIVINQINEKKDRCTFLLFSRYLFLFLLII